MVAVGASGGGAAIVNVESYLHPFASVIVSVYKPAHLLVIRSTDSPLDHECIIGYIAF